jgi:hypothetical protein
VPRLLDLAMRNRLLHHYRQQTIASGRGLVLEVGVGSGLNLPLYGPAVTRVVAIDPSPELFHPASKRTAEAVVPVSLLPGSAEHVPFTDAAFDAIVMTCTLCSISESDRGAHRKFPVPMRRELGRKPLNSAIDFEPIVALGGLDEQNSLYFPC